MDSGPSTITRATPFRIRRSVIVITCWFILLLTTAVAIRYGIISWRENECKSKWNSQLYLVAAAVSSYPYGWGNTLPASVLNEDGQPIHSWRVLILPFVESDPYFQFYSFDEPWDGPNNKRLVKGEDVGGNSGPYYFALRSQLYQVPRVTESEGDFNTNLVMVVDSNRPLVPVTGRIFASNTEQVLHQRIHAGSDFMIVAIQNSDIHWMEPRDLSAEELLGLIRAEATRANSCLRTARSVFVSADESILILNEEDTLARLQEMQHNNGEANGR